MWPSTSTGKCRASENFEARSAWISIPVFEPCQEKLSMPFLGDTQIIRISYGKDPKRASPIYPCLGMRVREARDLSGFGNRPLRFVTVPIAVMGVARVIQTRFDL